MAFIRGDNGKQKPNVSIALVKSKPRKISKIKALSSAGTAKHKGISKHCFLRKSKAKKYYGSVKALHVRNILDICLLRMLGAHIPTFKPEVTHPPSDSNYLYGLSTGNKLKVLSRTEKEKTQLLLPPLDIQQLSHLLKATPHMFHTVYTDGSYYKRFNCSGYAVYWGKNHPNNAFGPVPERGQLNSAKAEEYAIFLALLIIKAEVVRDSSEGRTKKMYRVLTDCAWALDDIQRWYRRWSKPTSLIGWKTQPTSSTEHREILRVTAGLLWDLRHMGSMVMLGWVKGHQGVVGNEIADQMAKYGGKTSHVCGPEPFFMSKEECSSFLTKER